MDAWLDFLLFSTAQPSVTVKNKDSRILAYHWMTSKKKKSGRSESLDSMLFSLHAKEAEMVV